MNVLTPPGWWSTHHGDVTQLVNSRYCVLVLCVLAASHVIIVSVYYRHPIHCYCSAHMTMEHCSTIKMSCLSHSVYKWERDRRTPLEEMLPLSIPRYYNFVSLILLLQALLFFIPSVIWRELTRNLGLIPEELSLFALEASRNRNIAEKESAVANITNSVKLFCMRQMRRRHVSYAFRWLHGNQLVVLRFGCLVLYASNVIGQFLMLDAFLGIPFHTLGWEIMGRPSMSFSVMDYIRNVLASLGLNDAMDILDNNGTVSSKIKSLLQNYSLPYFEDELVSVNSTAFPLDVICGFETTHMEYVRVYKFPTHCHLPANSLNELVFTFVWFLLCSVAVVTMATLFMSIFQFVSFPCRRMGIRERLQDSGVMEKSDPFNTDTINKIELFEKEFLQRDGLFLLSYIDAGGGDLLTDEVLELLWTFYERERSDMERIAKPTKWAEQFLEDKREIPARANVHDSTNVLIPLQKRSVTAEEQPAYGEFQPELTQ